MDTPDNSRHQCILCGKDTAPVLDRVYDVRFGIDSAYRIDRCLFCTTEQLHPRPDIGLLTSLYNSYYNFTGSGASRYSRLREAFLFSAPYRLWLAVDGDISFQSARGSGRLLDIGCNEGRGLLFYRRNGFVPEGLELNAVAAAEARSRGFAVHAEHLEDFRPDTPFDVAVLSNVLEHSLDPRGMLRHVQRVLRPGGEVWISCPNGASWLRRLFGRYWINWHVPFHIVFFSRVTLQRLLQDAGFEVREVRQETPAVWFAYSVLALLFARRGRPTRQMRNPMLLAGLMVCVRAFLFPVLWLGNRLGSGDCLVVRARRLPA